MTRTSSWCSSAVLAAALLLSPVARGDAFQRDYEGALVSYKAARYAEAIARFQRAYERRPLPRLLINIGRAHLKLGDAQRALVYFNRYLEAERSPDPVVKEEVERDIGRAFEVLSKQKEAELAPASAAPASLDPAPPARPAPAPAPAPSASSASSAPPVAAAARSAPPPERSAAPAPPEPPWRPAPERPPPPAPPPTPEARRPESSSVAFIGRDPRSAYTVSAGGQVCTTPCSLALPPGPTPLLVSGGGPRLRRLVELPRGPSVVQVQHFTRSRVIAGAILLTLSIPLGVGAGLALAPVSTALPSGATWLSPTDTGIAVGTVLGAHALSFFVAGVAQLATIRRASIEVLGP